MAEQFLTNKKIALIIAFKNFKDEEYFITKQCFDNAGALTITVSDSLGMAIGVDGGEAQVNLTMKGLIPEKFDAIIFIGGGGSQKYIADPQAHSIATKAVSSHKILGAICIAPAILAEARVLTGKRATVWSSAMDKSMVKILKENKAVFEDKAVVEDEKIITANGPLAAKAFAEKIIEMLTKK